MHAILWKEKYVPGSSGVSARSKRERIVFVTGENRYHIVLSQDTTKRMTEIAKFYGNKAVMTDGGTSRGFAYKRPDGSWKYKDAPLREIKGVVVGYYKG